MLNDDERETVLFTASREVAQAAIAQVASCEACNPDAASSPQQALCISDTMLGPSLWRASFFSSLGSYSFTGIPTAAANLC